MWLLDTSTLVLQEFSGINVPEYAILSHTWEQDEVLFHEMEEPSSHVQQKTGFKKVQTFCTFAKAEGYEYAWADTCCIDKRSSAELTEAINSMFIWYRSAGVCIIYLSDVQSVTKDESQGVDTDSSSKRLLESFKSSRWFTRGWTLQELIANPVRRFYSSDWHLIAFGKDTPSMEDICGGITGIIPKVLLYSNRVSKICVAQRMSWASKRQTTRPEDGAYSLMGIFGVSMPILYGEGLRNAFRRLQEEIMKRSFDQTLFAWRGKYKTSGLLARSPADFQETPTLEVWAPDMLSPTTSTNVGIHIMPCVYKGRTSLPDDTVLGSLQCMARTDEGWLILFIRLRRIEGAFWTLNGQRIQAYRRVSCDTWGMIPERFVGESRSVYTDLLVLEDEHFDLVDISIALDRRRAAQNNYGSVPKTLRLGDSRRSTQSSDIF